MWRRDALCVNGGKEKGGLYVVVDGVERETGLLAVFTTERSAWTDREAMLISGFHEIEDIVDGELPSFSFFELSAVG